MAAVSIHTISSPNAANYFTAGDYYLRDYFSPRSFLDYNTLGLISPLMTHVAAVSFLMLPISDYGAAFRFRRSMPAHAATLMIQLRQRFSMPLSPLGGELLRYCYFIATYLMGPARL